MGRAFWGGSLHGVGVEFLVLITVFCFRVQPNLRSAGGDDESRFPWGPVAKYLLA